MLHETLVDIVLYDSQHPGWHYVELVMMHPQARLQLDRLHVGCGLHAPHRSRHGCYLGHGGVPHPADSTGAAAEPFEQG